jgi:hypothetical protein
LVLSKQYENKELGEQHGKYSNKQNRLDSYIAVSNNSNSLDKRHHNNIGISCNWHIDMDID